MRGTDAASKEEDAEATGITSVAMEWMSVEMLCEGDSGFGSQCDGIFFFFFSFEIFPNNLIVAFAGRATGDDEDERNEPMAAIGGGWLAARADDKRRLKHARWLQLHGTGGTANERLASTHCLYTLVTNYFFNNRIT